MVARGYSHVRESTQIMRLLRVLKRANRWGNIYVVGAEGRNQGRRHRSGSFVLRNATEEGAGSDPKWTNARE